MRKLILLSSVFALTMGVFAQKEADAFLGGLFGAATGIGQATVAEQNQTQDRIKEVRDETQDVEAAVKENTNTLQTEINERFMNLYLELRKMSEQLTTVATANTGAIGGFASASNSAGAITAQQSLNAGSMTKFVNQADFACVAVSGEKSTSLIMEAAEQATAESNEQAMENINSQAGTDAENGLIDYQRKLFEKATGLCDPDSIGGAASFCTGDGTSHISLATLLSTYGFSGSNPINADLNYLQEVLYARIPISVNPDLLEDPNTSTMNMVVEADRLKAELSIGQTLFSMLKGNRTKAPNASAINSLKERYVANGWSQPMIDNMFDGGISKNSMYHALTVGSYGSTFMLQQLSGNDPINYLTVIAKEAMLNNVLQFEQYKLLEAIALATATNIVVNRDDAIKDLNARISAANSRN